MTNIKNVNPNVKNEVMKPFDLIEHPEGSRFREVFRFAKMVFTGTGPYAFCTGGNTKEYSEFYSKRCDEYGQYMELFNHMVDSILACKNPLSAGLTA